MTKFTTNVNCNNCRHKRAIEYYRKKDEERKTELIRARKIIQSLKLKIEWQQNEINNMDRNIMTQCYNYNPYPLDDLFHTGAEDNIFDLQK